MSRTEKLFRFQNMQKQFIILRDDLNQNLRMSIGNASKDLARHLNSDFNAQYNRG